MSNSSMSDAKLAEKVKKGFLKGEGVCLDTGVQLDMLAPTPNGKRNMPNDIARSSLFVAKGKDSARAIIKRQTMFHLHKDISIVYTGEELRADDDELVWMEILNISQTVKLGDPFEFNIIDLIKSIGWSRNGHYYDKVRQCLSRLKATEVLFNNAKKYGVSGSFSLIQRYDVINDDQPVPTHYRMYLDPEIVFLFVSKNYSLHEWDIYRKLSPVARRLADYTQSHRTPNPLNVSDFHALCGSENKNLRSWNQRVKKAIAELAEAGIITNGSINSNKIYLARAE